MLTKEKRNKIIAGAIVLSMLASTAGCGSNENEEQEENGSANISMVYPWWMFWHWPMFGGTTTNVRQGTPVPGNTAGTDANTAGNSDGSSDNSTDGTDNTGSQEAAQTPDPVTGLITQADGTLIDPNTGGTVDPEDGSIHDALTGQYIGLADRYLNATVCAVPAKN